MARPRRGTGFDDATASPLWGLTLVLAEIAERLERRRAEEHTPDPVPTGRRPGRHHDGTR